jgi:hypothetical protein
MKTTLDKMITTLDEMVDDLAYLKLKEKRYR